MWLEQTTIGQPTLHSRDTQGTKGDHRGTTWIVL